MLVLGMASWASADLTGIQLSLNGVINGNGNTAEITVPICTEIAINVHGPFDYGWGGVLFIHDTDAYDDGQGNIMGMGGEGGEWGDQLGPPYSSGYYYSKDGYPIVYDAAGDEDLRGAIRFEYATTNPGDAINGYGYNLTASAFGEVPGGKEFDLMYHCSGRGDVTIYLWDLLDVETPQDTIIVHQVPEPMTITLLGLGGLLLRRRKW
jgi:hypothetical protein